MKKIDVVCVILHNEANQLLIAKRKSHIADGIWEFPGGKVEPHETKEAACIRECREELNVDIEIDRFLMDFHDDAFSDDIHVFAYAAHIVSGVIAYQAHSEGAWVTRSQLYDYTFQKADRVLLDYLQDH